jgi:AraC-like DNA-binding protein
MTSEETKLKNIATAKDIKADMTIDYLDDDIIMIDNVRLLTTANSARLNMNAIAFCNKGKAQLELNGTPVLFDEDHIMICPPNTNFDNLMLSPDFDFKAIFMTDRILMSFLRDKMNVWTELLFVHKMHVIPISKSDVNFLRYFYEILNMEIQNQHENPYKTEVVQSFLRGAILGICGNLKIRMQQAEESMPTHTRIPTVLNSSQHIFQQFISLLSATPQKHRPVDYYATELCITPKYLSSICKKQSGKTANEWIKEHVLEDIRYQLKQTNHSIKQICSILGFPNPSFFGKYVKDHFGVTPAQLRRQ